jgi:hypothetical protein
MIVKRRVNKPMFSSRSDEVLITAISGKPKELVRRIEDRIPFHNALSSNSRLIG